MENTKDIQIRINGLIVSINIQPDESNPAPVECRQKPKVDTEFEMDTVNKALLDATEEDRQNEAREENNDLPFVSTDGEPQPKTEPKSVFQAIIKDVSYGISRKGTPQVTWIYDYFNEYGHRTEVKQYTVIDGKNWFLLHNLKLLGIQCKANDDFEMMNYQPCIGRKVEIEEKINEQGDSYALLKRVITTQGEN